MLLRQDVRKTSSVPVFSNQVTMIHQIIHSALSMLVTSKLMSHQDLANIANMPLDQMHSFVDDRNESVLSMEHLNNIVAFFGPEIFQESFASYAVLPSSTSMVRFSDFPSKLKHDIELHKVMCGESTGVYTSELLTHKTYLDKVQQMISALNDPLPEGGSEWTIPADKK